MKVEPILQKRRKATGKLPGLQKGIHEWYILQIRDREKS